MVVNPLNSEEIDKEINMAKYIGPKCKLARREGMDIELKSNIRPIGEKCKINRLPGQHMLPTRLSTYGKQLREKQKVKRIYGILESQFKKYYLIASKITGNTGVNLLVILERRLDNVVFRLGFGATRAHARQLVSHKAVLVNGSCCNIASRILSVGDVVSLKEKNKNRIAITESVKRAENNNIFPWLVVDYNLMSGVLMDLPERDFLSRDINEQLIVELYSGKK
jgi:small subunit ribosomal protein S4